ncbi:MAG TPA: squalene synthase HpnC [Burkholderiaceae bacterium]|nr:squalene synthase HpnC [Burkholderiaceae bacterium]
MSVDHYENFPVASLLCPPALRPAVAAIYHFARTADDIADEGDAPPAQRLADLAAYRADLAAACNGDAISARWPQVFDPLRTMLAGHALPVELLGDLLDAFEQDVVKTRYADRAELLDYCRRSANPVGRLLLHLYGVGDAQALRRSDAICTALQLANFWQDLGVDTRRGRLYAPASDCARSGVDAAALLAQRDAPNVRALVGELVGWTRELMLAGAPLVHAIPGRAGWELRLVVQGGLRILEKIAALDFATLQSRPKLHWHDAPLLLWRALWMRAPRAVVASTSA